MCVYMGLLKLRDVEMTQKTKLEIIGPYTPEHEVPFWTRDGRVVRIICKDRIGSAPVIGLVGFDGYDEFIVMYTEDGFRNADKSHSRYDLMNAREFPVAREFWVNEFQRGDGYIGVSHLHETKDEAIREREELPGWNWTSTIHVREVLPGEGA